MSRDYEFTPLPDGKGPDELDAPEEAPADYPTRDDAALWDEPVSGFESQPSGFESQPSGFESQPSGFESQPSGFESQAPSFEAPDYPAAAEPPAVAAPPAPGPAASRPRRDGVPPLLIAVILLLVLAASAAAWWWFMGRVPSGEQGRREALEAMTQPAAPPPPPPIAVTEAPPPLELPALEESDSVLRSWIGELSEHPKLAAWLTPDDLARRFVATVDNIARGESPRPHLTVMAPETGFQVDGSDQRAVASPASYARYDLAVEVFSSLDIAAAARLFHNLEPLLEEAYGELGDPSRDFRATLAEAIDHLIAVEIPAQPPLLEKSLLVYKYVDPELEAQSPAAKQLLRLGPENARKVQTKLRFLRAALDLPE